MNKLAQLRESETHFRADHPDEALLLDGRCLAVCFGLHGALGHARQRARDANTTYLPRRTFASPQKLHRGGSRHALGRDPRPTDGRTNLGKQKPDCKRLKTSSLIDPSYGTKAAAQFALQVIESCTARRVSRMILCEKNEI